MNELAQKTLNFQETQLSLDGENASALFQSFDSLPQVIKVEDATSEALRAQRLEVGALGAPIITEVFESIDLKAISTP